MVKPDASEAKLPPDLRNAVMQALRDLAQRFWFAEMVLIDPDTSERDSASPPSVIVVERLEKLRIKVHSDERHALPHFHVELIGTNASASVEIRTRRVLERSPSFQQRKLKPALEWAEAHEELLLRVWDEVTSQKLPARFERGE